MEDPINQSQKERARGSSIRHKDKLAPKTKPTDPGCCSCFAAKPEPKEVDALLIGAGIMSSTVGLMLKQLEPSWKIVMVERLHAVAEESSNGFNNAGTGHAGFMEPNYTKEKFEEQKDKRTPPKLKTVTTDKVFHVCQQFNTSRIYWDYLLKKGLLPDPNTFIHQTDHIALGIGKDQVEFIEKRYEAMKNHESGLFSSMEIARPDERKKQEEWAPLITAGRDGKEPICMTKVRHGTDVDFGALSRAQVNSFMKLGGDLRLFTTVTDIKKDPKDGKWIVTTKNTSTGRGVTVYKTPFVYVGAGGWALLMLQKAGLPQVRGYMALPVTGDWAVCQNPDVVHKHKVKVYAPGAPGAPPMSMPHLDYRTIGGKEMLLFGPFGSITLKFLRYGSVTDALKALKPHNILPTVGALSRNLSLAVMLMKDVFKSGKGKLNDIRHYYPEADPEDWTLIPAGVRAQIIKKDPKTGKGMLQFGTEVITDDAGTICGLLGASPGASTCVTIGLDTLEKCFKDKPQWATWGKKLQEMIFTWAPNQEAGDMAPAFKTPERIEQIYRETGRTLKVEPK
jgi:malate dehydrogenase (quinone)